MTDDVQVRFVLPDLLEGSPGWIHEQLTGLGRSLRTVPGASVLAAEGEPSEDGARAGSDQIIRDLCIAVPASTVALRAVVDAVRAWSTLCRLRTPIRAVSWAFSESGCPVVLADQAAEDRPALDR
jgi:hypothetical protein